MTDSHCTVAENLSLSESLTDANRDDVAIGDLGGGSA